MNKGNDRWGRREYNPNWKGGEYVFHGYVFVRNTDHPFRQQNNYIRKHRLVYEEYYKCCILPWVDVHHINGDTLDNSIENLTLLPKDKHGFIHNKKDFSDRICLLCNYQGETKQWNRYNGSYICWKCYMRLYNKRIKRCQIPL